MVMVSAILGEEAVLEILVAVGITRGRRGYRGRGKGLIRTKDMSRKGAEVDEQVYFSLFPMQVVHEYGVISSVSMPAHT
jgi:hypothetical protein